MEVIDNYDGSSKLKTFIIGIALNKIRQYHDKVKKLEEISLNEDIITDQDEELSGDNLDKESKKLKELRDKLEVVFTKLSDRYRKVLKLAYIENLSTAEMARELETSNGNIRVLKHRAINKATEIANKIKSTNV
jgi:RNA polymerase sigma factor (sigma-70 family)